MMLLFIILAPAVNFGILCAINYANCESTLFI